MLADDVWGGVDRENSFRKSYVVSRFVKFIVYVIFCTYFELSKLASGQIGTCTNRVFLYK